MCFDIDKNAERPVAKYGWKIVEQKHSGYLYSLFYDDISWQPDIEQRMKPGVPTSIQNRADRQAHGGIYVYTSKRTALKAYRYWNSDEIFLMRVHIDPKDWLFTSTDGTQATYRGVTPCEVQPEFDWI